MVLNLLGFNKILFVVKLTKQVNGYNKREDIGAILREQSG